MDYKFWLKVLAYILKLILEGTSREKALRTTSARFGLSEADIEANIGDKF